MRYVSRRELADLLSLRDVSWVIHQAGFPAAVRLKARVCRWSLDEVLVWLDGRKAQSAAAPTLTPRRRARRRPVGLGEPPPPGSTPMGGYSARGRARMGSRSLRRARRTSIVGSPTTESFTTTAPGPDASPVVAAPSRTL